MTATRQSSSEGVGVARLRQFTESHGDVWAATWADDDSLYVVSDDSAGFDRACWSNLAISRLDGDSVTDLRGHTINAMTNYGKYAEIGDDGATWKGTGLVSVDSVLYLGLSRHRYGTPPYYIQQTWDGLILASEDHGQTWHRSSEAPTFPGRQFSNPNFVQTGQDGTPPDLDDGYLYAVSNDGSWNNGNVMLLGRVHRKHAAILDPGSWQFWAGTTDDGDPQWRADLQRADFVLRRPGHLSMTGVTYLPELSRYCMPQWHYLFDETQTTLDWSATIGSTPTTLDFYTAKNLWGPWTLRHSLTSDEGWYNPCILPKPLSDMEPNTVPVFAAGLGGGKQEFYNLNLFTLPLDVLTD